MDRNVVAQVSEDTLKLQRVLGSKLPGETLSYDDLAAESEVRMDNSGKAKLRTALKRLRLEYSPVHGFGVRLAEPALVMPLLSSKIVRIDRAVKRADRTQKNLQVQFFSSLTPEEQRQVLFAGAVFGAIRIAAENGRQLYNAKTKQVGNNSVIIPLPKM
jgi:hypothetical protein